MFCKNCNLALKICFKADETFRFLIFAFLLRFLDVIWRMPGTGREIQEEKSKRQFQ